MESDYSVAEHTGSCPQNYSYGDNTCDILPCGDEDLTCIDCQPINRKTLTLKCNKINNDQKSLASTGVGKMSFREPAVGGEYEIFCQYFIIHANGTKTKGTAYRTQGGLAAFEVERDEIELCVNRVANNTCKNTPQTQGATWELTTIFNPNTDKVYLMWYEGEPSKLWAFNNNKKFLKEIKFHYQNKFQTRYRIHAILFKNSSFWY